MIGKISKKHITTVVILVVIAVAALLIKTGSPSEVQVRVVGFEPGVCTLDVPSSSCGPYTVNVKNPKREHSSYEVPGFRNRESKQYDEISTKVMDAKTHNTLITLTVNGKDEITAVH